MLISTARSQVMEPDGYINLNPGSCSPVQKPVFEELIQHLTHQSSDPTDFIWATAPKLIEKGRNALAAFLECGPEHLILCTNASHGINSILQTFPWQTGDEILTTDQEYHHYQMLFKTVAELRGVTFIKVQLPLINSAQVSEIDYNDSILKLFREKKTAATRAIFFSHITSPVGQRLPAKELCAWAKKEQLISVVDGAHGPGQIRVSLKDINPDFYIANLHKWMMNPAGCAFLYAAPEVRRKFKPLIIMAGYGALAEGKDRINAIGAPVWNYAHEYHGTANLTPMSVLWKTIEEFEAIGIGQIEAAWKEHRADLVDRLQSLNLDIISPMNPDLGSCMVSVRIPVPGSKIDCIRARHVFRHAHKLELAFPTLENGCCLLRVSAAWFATKEQFDYLISILKNFDWHTLAVR
jgi:isopenicillin-N epimerase